MMMSQMDMGELYFKMENILLDIFKWVLMLELEFCIIQIAQSNFKESGKKRLMQA